MGAAEELPPRARRIPPHTAAVGAPQGTTSACAENTLPHQSATELTQAELPPRARRILTATVPMPKPLGTTSACAENTLEWEPAFLTTGNYLRVRGEYA